MHINKKLDSYRQELDVIGRDVVNNQNMTLVGIFTVLIVIAKILITTNKKYDSKIT